MSYKRPADRYTQQARRDGFAARSVFKLEEIDRRAKLLRPGMKVLDLGAAPGSWVQYLSPRVGKVVAVDLEPLRVGIAANVVALQRDVNALEPSELLPYGPFDLVVSDMAPHTTGVPFADAARSEELVERALVLAVAVSKPGSRFLAKIFQGEGFEELRKKLRVHYRSHRILKPEATRRESRELYLLAEDRSP